MCDRNIFILLHFGYSFDSDNSEWRIAKLAVKVAVNFCSGDRKGTKKKSFILPRKQKRDKHDWQPLYSSDQKPLGEIPAVPSFPVSDGNTKIIFTFPPIVNLALTPSWRGIKRILWFYSHPSFPPSYLQSFPFLSFIKRAARWARNLHSWVIWTNFVKSSPLDRHDDFFLSFLSSNGQVSRYERWLGERTYSSARYICKPTAHEVEKYWP